MNVYSNNMSDNFLSKENMTKIYKTLLNENNYNDITKQDKISIINELKRIMKQKLSKLNMGKINDNNIHYLTLQYNNLCLKEITEYVKKNLSLNNQEREFNQRKYNRDFQKFNDKPVISNMPEPTKYGGDLNERIKKMEEMRKQNTYQSSPTHNMNNIYNSNNHHNDHHNNHHNDHHNDAYNNHNNIQQKPQSLMEKMAELEKSRGIVQNERPSTPDFLKSQSVGNKNSTPRRAPMSNKSSGFAGFNSDSNIVSVNFNQNNSANNSANNSVNNKIDESISIEDRLRMMEQEREQMLNPHQNAPVHNNNNPVINPPMNSQPPQSVNQPVNQPQLPQSVNQPVNQPIQQNNVNMELINHLNDNVEQFNIILEELSLLRTQVNNKHSYLQLEVNKNASEYIYKFKEISNIVGIKLISYSLPEQSYNFNESIITYKINGFQMQIRIEKGFYNINTLLMMLNKNDGLHFSLNYKKRLCVTNKTNNLTNNDDLITINNFTFEECDIIRKLGFSTLTSHNGILEASNIIDFRNDTKLKLYLNNIDSKSPFGILNFNNSSICEFSFKKTIKLNNLHILFKTINGQNYDFDSMMYNLSFQLIILN